MSKFALNRYDSAISYKYWLIQLSLWFATIVSLLPSVSSFPIPKSSRLLPSCFRKTTSPFPSQHNCRKIKLPAASFNDDINHYSENATSKPYLELIHPQTNVTIDIVGCLHGASSSAKVVETILNKKQTDVVVLELCPTRYKDLMKFMQARDEQNPKYEIMTNEEDNINESTNSMVGEEYIRMVSKTIETRGISTGIAAAVLGGASGLSSALSGFESGLEFITAIKYVKNRNCDIILGDQIVHETLKRVGSLPTVSLNMWNEFLQQNFNWNESYGNDATVLSDAIWGDTILKNRGLQIDLGSVLFRNKDVMVDLFRLTLPTFVFIQMVAILASLLSNNSVSIESITPILSQSEWIKIFLDRSLEIFTSALILFTGYITIALPSVKVILSERDTQLVKSVEAACQIASEKYRHCNDSTSSPRVVVILGLLHVNGVVKSLVSR